MKKALAGCIKLTDHTTKTPADIFLTPFTTYVDLTIQWQGTLYNQNTLKTALEIDGNIDDATLIMIAYQKWGIALLHKLDGIFAFALFDTKNQQLFLAKDRISIKPLFYYHDSQHLAFAGKLKSLIKLPNVTKELNQKALANYFTYGYILQPNTIYQNCFKVRSGYYIDCNTVTGIYEEKKYVQPMLGVLMVVVCNLIDNTTQAV